ncbi:NCS2 family permease [Halorussus limi]|uniref:NCS2 family permease n=1 Tax=Halorussus limi TaxID=2938695 RepID=A0A8U0HXE6_9EURY|nr:NCS2 family permease [Halorussus limi]UPV75792.1 NCS2 family permease [Halorussus limi]
MGVFESAAEYFEFERWNTDVRTEVTAGLTTFLTMSYIVVVNPAVLADNPQSAVQDGISIAGHSTGEVRAMLAVVTIIAAATGTLVMALYANRPFAQAPGMGLNAFFAFTVVGAMGVPWRTALAAVFVEGILFAALTLVGARTFIMRLFPKPVKFSVGTGIGLFLALIGLKEMRVVVADPATLVTLGGVASDPVAMVSVVGLLGTFGLYARDVPGSVVLGIVGTTLLGWLVTAVGLVPESAGLVAGSVSPTYDISPLAGSFVAGFETVDLPAFALVVFMLFFVDFFNTAGALTGVSQIAGFLDEDGNLPDAERPLMADAVATTVGGALGTSTVTTYIESATGIEEGGRTGMTALVVGLLFVAALAVVPLAAAIPLYASHIAVVVIGVVMLQNVVDIDWDDITHVVPAGLTVLLMPFTYSIAYGIAAGIVSYPLIKLAAGERRDVSAGQWLLAAAFVLYFFVRTGDVLSAAT